MQIRKNKYTIVVAKDNLNILTVKQRLLWNYFYENNSDIKPIDKSTINPSNIASLLPDVWMADLSFDDNKKLVDAEIRLVGSKVANMYGDRTHKKLLSDDSSNSYQKEFPESYQRLLVALNIMLEEDTAVIVKSDFLSEDKKYISTTGLMIPVYNNSDQINMLFGIHEGIMKDYTK